MFETAKSAIIDLIFNLANKTTIAIHEIIIHLSVLPTVSRMHDAE